MLEGMNYLHAKFQINIFRNKKVIKLLELWTLWKKKRKKKKKKIANTIGCYHNSKKIESNRSDCILSLWPEFRKTSFSDM